MASQKLIGALLFEGFELLDVYGPLEATGTHRGTPCEGTWAGLSHAPACLSGHFVALAVGGLFRDRTNRIRASLRGAGVAT
jgi:hypothetical protein